ncbi:putative receptor-like protein kinase [Hibiscus syriacus]|uniref:Receptor-like protein kinase n=1 Tax=Hibiscus syriacus TaxID=106335 RepID=A0A6A3C1C9_HIBSY|nr:putative receptor-like protein kinase [Hibiscus syriacus]
MGKVQGWQLLSLLLLLVLSAVFRSGEAQVKSFLINCGTDSSLNVDGRKWVGDLTPDNNLTLSSPGVVSSTSTLSGDSIFATLYKSARLFSDDLNYTFNGILGNYFLRLHFCPFPLRITTPGSNSSFFSLVKEYILPVNSNTLVIEFTPKKGSFGFINAIEIIPLTNKLFADSVSKVGGKDANLNLSGRGIETMYRLNVGGPEINPTEDSNYWRAWEVDSGFMITANAGSEMHNSSNVTYASANDSSVAPLLVYETARSMSNNQVLEKRFNMSWRFEVDPGFDYLIRLHFCELDYFDAVSSQINTLWIQLGPDTAAGASGTDALLNGLEIFKLSRNGNLAHVQRYDSTGSSNHPSKFWVLWVGIAAGVASVVILAVAVIRIIYFCKKQGKESGDTKNNTPGWRPLFLHGSVLNSSSNAKRSSRFLNPNGSMTSTGVGKQFTLAEIRAATNNFDESLVIGVGGFGKVFKGEVEDGTLAAIKRANPQSEQGLAEFHTEIEMLSKLRHRHLVSMIGFCDEQNEMILVYEYMANGTLRSHLFGSDVPPLTWKQRLEACIGAARGLHYLHTGAERGIIHRDVKTTNILLDENFVAKMSDFGLSKTGPSMEHTHVSTAVKGSFGYLDPEYFRRQQLTEKSDVYSFGVVLFEVVCARAVINPSLPKDQINLAEWAMRWQRQRLLDTIIDPHLKGKYSPESMEKFGEIAEKCLADEGKNRPTMGEVLWHLEYVLQLHQAWIGANPTGNSFSSSRALRDLEERETENRQLDGNSCLHPNQEL